MNTKLSIESSRKLLPRYIQTSDLQKEKSPFYMVRFYTPNSDLYKSVNISFGINNTPDKVMHAWEQLTVLEADSMRTGGEKTAEHSLGVIDFLDKLGIAYGLDYSARNKNKKIALLHDHGKTHPQIANLVISPEKLSEEQKISVRQQHTILGHDELRKQEFSRDIYLSALYHHEEYKDLKQLEQQGKLTPEEVLYISMLVIADSTEAAINPNRPYRKPKSASGIISEIITGMDTGKYNPQLSQAYLTAWNMIIGQEIVRAEQNYVNTHSDRGY